MGNKHPGKTPAQRRVLDQIGCGNYRPIADGGTLASMLRQGLIVELPPVRFPLPPLGYMEIREFDMPTLIHMRWCEAMSSECDALEQSGEEGLPPEQTREVQARESRAEK